jgi:hypothetical protein
MVDFWGLRFWMPVRSCRRPYCAVPPQGLERRTDRIGSVAKAVSRNKCLIASTTSSVCCLSRHPALLCTEFRQRGALLLPWRALRDASRVPIIGPSWKRRFRSHATMGSFPESWDLCSLAPEGHRRAGHWGTRDSGSDGGTGASPERRSGTESHRNVPAMPPG